MEFYRRQPVLVRMSILAAALVAYLIFVAFISIFDWGRIIPDLWQAFLHG